MSLRFYLCSIVGDGQTEATAYRAKIDGMVARHSCMIPSNADGSPKFQWAVVVARATDWSTVDADASNEKLFDTADLPDSINTFAEVKVFLMSKTVGDMAAARRQRLNNLLTSKGIDISGVTLQTTMWQVLRGIYRHLNGGADIGTDGPRA